MIAPVGLAQGAPSGLPAAIEEVRSGRFPGAWSAAQAEPRSLERAQALAYVRHHAGDLEGALQLAEEGLRMHPADPWLRRTALEVALALHLGARAAGHLEARGADAEPEQNAEVVALLAGEARAAAGVQRARWITGLAGASLLLALLWFGRSGR